MTTRRLPRRIRKQSWRMLYSSPRAVRLDRESWRRCSARIGRAFDGMADTCGRIVAVFNKMFNDWAASFIAVRMPSFEVPS